MKLFPYQQRFIDENPSTAILAWEMRVGKSLPGAIWIDKPEQAGNTFVITPKQNKKDWEKFNTKAKVLTKEEFRKNAKDIILTQPTAILVDEAHTFASPLFVKGRSQLAEALYSIIKKYPLTHVLLLTATPIRQDAWSLHTLLCYIGVYYDWKEWRDEFFVLRKMPYLRFAAYFPRADWRIKIRKYLEKHCNILSLVDVVEYLPEPKTQIIKLKQPKYVKPTNEVVTWTHEHRYEQQGKAKEILALGYKKLIVVCHYREQIDELEVILSKEKSVFILDGRTKDADAIKTAAQEADECYFIVQASMGFSFDGWMFGAIVFVSMSHSCLNHTQMTGRLTHTQHIKICEFYYLIGGRWDQAIYETIQKGEDFNPHKYLHKYEHTA